MFVDLTKFVDTSFFREFEFSVLFCVFSKRLKVHLQKVHFIQFTIYYGNTIKLFIFIDGHGGGCGN